MSKEKDISTAKEKFVQNAHWADSIGSAFQRSYAYKKNVDENTKREFKKKLFEQVKRIESQYLENAVTEKAHLNNINRLKKWTRNYSSLFSSGILKYGICQKLLNVYLKERWCAGILTNPPPHLPVDRLIQVKLKIKPLVNWTQIETEVEYMEVVNRIREIADSKGLSLAELELLAYNDLAEERR